MSVYFFDRSNSKALTRPGHWQQVRADTARPRHVAINHLPALPCPGQWVNHKAMECKIIFLLQTVLSPLVSRALPAPSLPINRTKGRRHVAQIQTWKAQGKDTLSFSTSSSSFLFFLPSTFNSATHCAGFVLYYSFHPSIHLSKKRSFFLSLLPSFYLHYYLLLLLLLCAGAEAGAGAGK